MNRRIMKKVMRRILSGARYRRATHVAAYGKLWGLGGEHHRMWHMQYVLKAWPLNWPGRWEPTDRRRWAERYGSRIEGKAP